MSRFSHCLSLSAATVVLVASSFLACSSDDDTPASENPGTGGQAGAATGGGAGTQQGGNAGIGGSAGAAGSTAGTAGAAGSTAGAGGEAGQSTGGSGLGGAAGGGAGPVDQLTDKASTAICDALFRCCNETDLNAYFYLYGEDGTLKDAGYANKIPPKAKLDEAGCKAILKEMMDIVPFGDWVAAVKAGSVQYDETAASSCLQALDAATCGKQVTEALFDSTCFFIAAPVGPVQRKLFSRTASSGADECTPIRDGTGARFFGTCDPTKSFCCYDNPDNPSSVCAFPYDADGNARKGHCKAASTEGQACSGGLTTVQLCVTGQDCDADTSKCEAPVAGDLNVGEPCIDDSFHLLGTCKDSWCDQLGTSKCKPYEPDGSDCVFAYECSSGGCNKGKCGAPTTCTSTQ